MLLNIGLSQSLEYILSIRTVYIPLVFSVRGTLGRRERRSSKLNFTSYSGVGSGNRDDNGVSRDSGWLHKSN